MIGLLKLELEHDRQKRETRMKVIPSWYALLLLFFLTVQLKYLKGENELKKCKIGNPNVKSVPGFKLQSVKKCLSHFNVVKF